jgi:SAM-dependent methyltransferase
MAERLLERHRRDWEDLGEVDPLWAILSVPHKQFGGWDIESFFHEGEKEISGVLATSRELGYPRQHERALDFGCGIGRLTRFLSTHFVDCYGVDISESMVAKANEINKTCVNCRFLHIVENDLRQFNDRYFDFVISRHVLQHLPGRRVIRRYIGELVRVLKPGGLLVFQLPTYIPFRRRLQGRRRLYTTLRYLGFRHQFLYERLSLNPVRMSYIAEIEVSLLLRSMEVDLLRTTPELVSRDGISANSYYVGRK